MTLLTDLTRLLSAPFSETARREVQKIFAGRTSRVVAMFMEPVTTIQQNELASGVQRQRQAVDAAMEIGELRK